MSHNNGKIRTLRRLWPAFLFVVMFPSCVQAECGAPNVTFSFDDKHKTVLTNALPAFAQQTSVYAACVNRQLQDLASKIKDQERRITDQGRKINDQNAKIERLQREVDRK